MCQERPGNEPDGLPGPLGKRVLLLVIGSGQLEVDPLFDTMEPELLRGELCASIGTNACNIKT